MFGQRAQNRLGGLSINTASANSATSQPPPSGSLFGSTSQQTKPTIFSLTSPSATSQPQPGASLFSSVNSKPSNLFGSSSQPTMSSAPQQSASLFGGALGSQNTSQGAQQQPANIFGASNIQQQPQQSGGIFGSSLQVPAQTQNAPSQSTSLFGGLGSSTGNSSLFGKSTAPPQAQSIFNNPPQPNSIFSSSIGQLSQQQQVVPGVRVTLNELRPTTRFNDLHEELQKIIENVDSFVLQQMTFKKECENMLRNISEQIDSIPQDTDFCQKNLEHLQRALENDAGAIAQAKSMTKSDAIDARLSWNVIDQLKMPQQFQHTGMWNTPTMLPNAGALYTDSNDEESGNRDLVGYFRKEADGMFTTLDACQRGIAEVDDYLQSLEMKIAQQLQQSRSIHGNGRKKTGAGDQIRDLALVLREFEGGILGVAGRVGETREVLQSTILGA